MSKWLDRLEDGTYKTEIESMEVCKWKVNEVCCNDKCEELGDYPYPSSNVKVKKDVNILRKKTERSLNND